MAFSFGPGGGGGWICGHPPPQGAPPRALQVPRQFWIWPIWVFFSAKRQTFFFLTTKLTHPKSGSPVTWGPPPPGGWGGTPLTHLVLKKIPASNPSCRMLDAGWVPSVGGGKKPIMHFCVPPAISPLRWGAACSKFFFAFPFLRSQPFLSKLLVAFLDEKGFPRGC